MWAPSDLGAPKTAQAARESVELTWFGTHAWQIRCGESVVLTDPWLTRFHTGTFTPDAGYVPDPRLVALLRRLSAEPARSPRPPRTEKA